MIGRCGRDRHPGSCSSNVFTTGNSSKGCEFNRERSSGKYIDSNVSTFIVLSICSRWAFRRWADGGITLCDLVVVVEAVAVDDGDDDDDVWLAPRAGEVASSEVKYPASSNIDEQTETRYPHSKRSQGKERESEKKTDRSKGKKTKSSYYSKKEEKEKDNGCRVRYIMVLISSNCSREQWNNMFMILLPGLSSCFHFHSPVWYFSTHPVLSSTTPFHSTPESRTLSGEIALHSPRVTSLRSPLYRCCKGAMRLEGREKKSEKRLVKGDRGRAETAGMFQYVREANREKQVVRGFTQDHGREWSVKGWEIVQCER